MSDSGTASVAIDWGVLARGENDQLSHWLRARRMESRWALCLITVVLGVGIYGATIGLWHGPLMALYVGIKLPLVILATLALNALINGMMAQLLGSGLSLRQATQALLMSFTVFALIVGSLSPITVFLVWNAPPSDSPEAASVHRQLLVTHTFLIAFAGIVSVVKLHGIVEQFSGSRQAARRTLLVWLAGNLFAGAQVGFLFRPIFGTPHLEVVFLRPDPFEGNFYESLWWALRHLGAS